MGRENFRRRLYPRVTGMHNTSREVVHALMPYDALLAPTLTRPAVRIGSLPSNPATGADEIYGWIAFTFPFNSTGQPAISIPNGFSKAGCRSRCKSSDAPVTKPA